MADDYTPGPVPKEALAFFRAKGLRLSFDYRKVWQAEHATAFTVAKAMQMDILQDIHAALEKALANGETFAQFKKELQPLLQKKGWWGQQTVENPDTGQIVEATLGTPRRLKTIYQTNITQAYHAGQWQRIWRNRKQFPYLWYRLGPSTEHRVDHQLWNNLVLPVEDPFWNTHLPQNGWGCKCHVIPVTQRRFEQLQAKNDIKTQAPNATYVEWTNKRTGELLKIPQGIDPGWDYNVGKVARDQHAAKVFANKLPGTDPAIASAVMARSIEFLLPELRRDYQQWVDGLVKRERPFTNELKVVGAISPETLAALAEKNIVPESAAITITDRNVLHLNRDTKKAVGKTLPEQDVYRLPEILAKPIAVLRELKHGGLLYAFEPTNAEDKRKGKLVVQLDFIVKIKDETGKRLVQKTNQIRTAGLVSLETLNNTGEYEVLTGSL